LVFRLHAKAERHYDHYTATDAVGARVSFEEAVPKVVLLSPEVLARPSPNFPVRFWMIRAVTRNLPACSPNPDEILAGVPKKSVTYRGDIL
jgi:hypothetical protein